MIAQGRTQFITLIFAGTMLVGCAQVGRMSEAIQSTVASGLSQPSPGASSGSVAPSEPATTPTSTNQVPTGPTPQAGGQRLPTQERKGTRTRITSVELDKYCQRLVAPFDLAVNAAVLSKVAADAAMASFPSQSKGTHLISKSVRDEAALMNWLPMSVEVKYGELQHNEFVSQGLLLSRTEPLGAKRYPLADKLLATVLEGVGPQPYSFRIFVRKANDDNAVALAGGFIYVDSSLLEPKKLAEAQFSIAHELGHVLQRHETRAAQARIIDAVSLGGNVRDLIGAMSDPLQISGELLKVAVVGKTLFQRHYEAQELQADACAVRILDQSSLNLAEVDNAITAFVRGLPPVESNERSIDVLSVLTAEERHPNTKQRRENLVAAHTIVRQERVKAAGRNNRQTEQTPQRKGPGRTN